MARIEFPFADPPRGPPTPPSRVCDRLLQPSRANDPPFPPFPSLRIPVCPKSQVSFPSRSFHASYSLTHRPSMACILRGLTILSSIALIYSLIPHPTTSFPIIVLKRTVGHGALTSSPLIVDGLQTFGLAFPLGKSGSLLISHRGPMLTYVQRRSLRYFLPGHGSRKERSSCSSSTESFVGSFRFRSFLFLRPMPPFCRAFCHTDQLRPPTQLHRTTTLLHHAAVILHRATVILPSSNHHP